MYLVFFNAFAQLAPILELKIKNDVVKNFFCYIVKNDFK